MRIWSPMNCVWSKIKRLLIFLLRVPIWLLEDLHTVEVVEAVAVIMVILLAVAHTTAIPLNRIVVRGVVFRLIAVGLPMVALLVPFLVVPPPVRFVKFVKNQDMVLLTVIIGMITPIQGTQLLLSKPTSLVRLVVPILTGTRIRAQPTT